MQHSKRRLKIVEETKEHVVEGTTCFAVHKKFGVNCERKRCQHWISHQKGHNCVLITAGEGPHTLQEIGEIYDLSRMRICQIEKTIFEKIRKSS